METVRLQTMIGPDGMVRIEVPSGFPPGPAEVIVVIAPGSKGGNQIRWCDFYGLGKEIWGDRDAQDHVNDLRDEWEDEPSR